MSQLERISFARRLSRYQGAIKLAADPVVEGRLIRMVGLTLEAEGCKAPVGSRCQVISDTPNGQSSIEAEVMGFSGNKIYLMPVDRLEGLQPGARVVPSSGGGKLPMGSAMLGRVVDGIGRPLDGKGSFKAEDWVDLNGPVINPLKRHPIEEPLDVGIRSINSLLTVGRGQRLGLFAGSGVGKSMLLRIAEYFRDQGKNVLLLMDSLTRFAQAQREIALAIGEPPATKGYPPSVFAKLPQLVERAGNAEQGGGSITAFYTVLSEGDDQQDPIADASRAILDGHVVLSRRLAEEGHYPAIDIEASISRAMPQIVSPEQLQKAQQFKQLYARYQQSRDLISVGAYSAGSDPLTDKAMEKMPAMQAFLRQGLHVSVNLSDSQAALEQTITNE